MVFLRMPDMSKEDELDILRTKENKETKKGTPSAASRSTYSDAFQTFQGETSASQRLPSSASNGPRSNHLGILFPADCGGSLHDELYFWSRKRHKHSRQEVTVSIISRSLASKCFSHTRQKVLLGGRKYQNKSESCPAGSLVAT